MVKFKNSPDNFSLIRHNGYFTINQPVPKHIAGGCLALLKALTNPPLLVLACGKTFFLGEGCQQSKHKILWLKGTVTFVAYAAPKFTKCVSERATSAGELDNDGTYFKSTTSITYSTCNSKNAITLTVKYKKTDAVLYGTATTMRPAIWPATTTTGSGRMWH